MNPADGRSELPDAIDGVDRPAGAGAGHRRAAARALGAGDGGDDGAARAAGCPGTDHEHRQRPPGPPRFIVDAHRELLDRCWPRSSSRTATSSPSSPGRAALLLRTLVLGSPPPGCRRAHRLTPTQIADVLLDGDPHPARRPDDRGGLNRCCSGSCKDYLAPYQRQLGLVVLLQFVGTMAALYLPSLNADIIDNGVVARRHRLHHPHRRHDARRLAGADPVQHRRGVRRRAHRDGVRARPARRAVPPGRVRSRAARSTSSARRP